MKTTAGLLAVIVAASALGQAKKSGPKVPAGLKPFEHLLGQWRSTGIPTKNRVRGGWLEKAEWSYGFEKGQVNCLVARFEQGKYFTELKLLPQEKKNHFKLLAQTPDKSSVTYEGELAGKYLKANRSGKTEHQIERITLALLHDIRYTTTLESKRGSIFRKLAVIGSTRKGAKFASVNEGPKCIVTGGLGTSTVSYQGKTYYVCCSGCKAEFNDNPEKYLREAKLILEPKKSGLNQSELKSSPDPETAAQPQTKAATRPSSAKETKAAKLFRQAELWEKNNRPGKAASLYRQLIKEFPESPQTAAAAQRLKQLPDDDS